MADHDELQAPAGTSTEEHRVSTGSNRIRDNADERLDGHVDALDYDYTNFYFGSGDDAFALLEPFADWWSQVHPRGYYQYELPLLSAPSTRVAIRDTHTGKVRDGLINFASYNYLGLSYRDEVKEAIKAAVDRYGGGSSGSPR